MTHADETKVLEKVREGFRRVGLTFPFLVGLIRRVDVRVDRRVESMGIFASGRLAVNPDFVQRLTMPDLMFVLAHELYHLTLRTHERSAGSDPMAFNQAHDYIINDMLRVELEVQEIPAGGLDWPGARFLSAEKILSEAEPNNFTGGRPYWDRFGEIGGEGESLWPGGGSGDVLDADLERQWFPDAAAEDQLERADDVQRQASRAMGMRAVMEAMRGHGTEPGGGQDTVTALRGVYRPPWELALQRWMESVAPGERSYARPSRRGADRTDVVLPGRRREGWTLHVVLDTSGSMVDELPRALGAIADFCDAIGVEQVRLIQCDTEVGRDEILAPAQLPQFEVSGFGGSDLNPAMLRLAEDADVHAAVIVTDGDIDYPNQPVPYRVLWALPSWKSPQDFTPPYGTVIAMA